MKTLDQAWKEAQEYLQSLPDGRAPHLSIAFSKDPRDVPITTNAYCCVAMFDGERKGVKGAMFWSWHSRGYENPVEAIEHCIESIKAFVEGRNQPRKDTVRGPAPLIDAPAAEEPIDPFA